MRADFPDDRTRRERLREWLAPYQAEEPLAARFRHRQLHAVLRLTPLAMAANIVNAGIVALAFRGTPHTVFTALWALLVTLAALHGLSGWRRARRRPPRATASLRALQRLTAHSAVLALVWAPMPVVLLPGAAPDAQILVATVTAGMMCAGGFALATVPLAGTVYTVILAAAAVVALLTSGLGLAPAITGLLLIYLAVVLATVWSTGRLFGARMVAEAEAERQNEVVGLLLRDFEENASDVLWETGPEGRLRGASERLLSLIGLPAERALHVAFFDWLATLAESGEDGAETVAELRRAAAAAAPFRDLVLPARVLGRARWLSIGAKPLQDEQGRPTGWRGVMADVTEAHLAHRQLRWLAHNDTLTGLRNRHQFRTELQLLLRSAPATGAGALLCLDLDHFKNVNDTLGHGTGDLLLQEVGRRLLALVRRVDTVARMGGDEFAILQRGVASGAEAEQLAVRIIAALSEPYRMAGSQVTIGCSIGIALLPEDGDEFDLVLSHADQALYAAKNAGRGTVRRFAPEMAATNRRRQQLKRALRGAVDRQALSLAYQPQVSVEDRRVIGFEALLRWHDPELGEIPPVEFVPLAEDGGLMPEIGRWVFEQACRDAAAWPGELQVSINVSPVQVMGSDVAAQATAAAAAAGLPPHRLEIEITESAFLHEGAGASVSILALHQAGFRLALDDFGTGYSALSYLRRYPFDTLKMDRSFVRDVLTRSDARAIVKMIVGLGRTLQLSTVAEGVEEPAQAALLQRLGCGVLQGYLVSRPMAAEAVPAFLRRWAAAPAAPWDGATADIGDAGPPATAP